MNPDGIEVFHIANGDRRVVRIPHDFVFNFFIAPDALFDQNLLHRRERKGIFHQRQKFRLVIGKTAACTAKGKSRTKHNRITDFLCGSQSFLH